MSAAVLTVLAASGLYALCSPALARWLSPPTATRLLVPASLAVAACDLFVLAMAALTWVGQHPEVAELGPWSPQDLRAASPIPLAAAATATGLLLAATVRAATITWHQGTALAAVCRSCRHLGAGTVIVVDTDFPDAFTTPHAAGRIIITRGMLDALDGSERRALLAHEHSHRTHRHAWWNLAGDLAAAVNPLLRPTARMIRHSTERWADEDAATAVADRRLVARAVARAALAQHAARARRNPPAADHIQAHAAAATGSHVPTRVAALLTPPHLRRLPAIAVLATLLAIIATASLTVQTDTERLFEHALLPAPHQ